MSSSASDEVRAPAAHQRPSRGEAEGVGPRGLKRNAALVPTDTAASRALVGVIAILTFLAALCAGAAELVAASSAEWRTSVAREVTIQVRPTAQRPLESEVAKAVELARRVPGVADVRALTQAESDRLLEPWLGGGLDLSGLPVPRLITLRLEPGTRPNLSDLRRSLEADVPGATLDDHGLWLERLSAMANTVIGLGLFLVMLVLVAAGLAVAFATRGAMAGNREVVDVLHLVGADHDFIAREFQRRFFWLGLRGGVIGGAAALSLLGMLGAAAQAFRASPAGDQIEALFGGLSMGWRGYASVFLMVMIVSVVTGIVSRLTVRRYLGGTA